MKKFPITRAEFGAYILSTKGKGSRRGSNKQCPLTNAIRSYAPKAKGDSGNRVTVGTYDELPKWALKFIELYDGQAFQKGISALAAARKVGAIK